MTAATPFHTNPSTIARYFFHDCERFLYYHAAGRERRERESIPDPKFDHSPLISAILASGFQWEEDVIRRLLKGRVIIGPGSGELHTRRLSPALTLRCLHREPPGRFLYQPTLVPPVQFYENYGIDPHLVVISDNHPDLLAILPDPLSSAAGERSSSKGVGRLLRVIDVKRGEALRLTHRVQILLYALELQAILDAVGITSARVDLDHGAVWLGKQDEPQIFDLGALRPHLERFLRHDLGRVLSGSAQDAHWHLYERCEWCEFFDHCRQEMRSRNDVSRLARLTSYGKRHLCEEADVSTLTELGRFLKRPDADEVLDRCASLVGQRHRLEVCVNALEKDRPLLVGALSPDLPKGENIALFLTLQQEPLGQAIYLAGLLVSAREDIRNHVFSPALAGQLFQANAKTQPCVWVAAKPDGTKKGSDPLHLTSAEKSAVEGSDPFFVQNPAQVRRHFIELLHQVLQQIHCYNTQQSQWKDQLSLQAYVHTEEERGLLFKLLLEALQEPDLAEEAMTLLFYFQGPELMQADRHPGNEVAYPVVVLLNAVSRLLALPVDVSYTLPEMLEVLGSSFPYDRKDYFHFPLGHGLRAEALHAAWYGQKKEGIEDIRQQARLHLFAIMALLRSIREWAGNCLVAWPPRFTLPSGTGIKDPLISRLAFFTRYESLLRYLAIRESRTEARPTQVLLGQVIELRARTSHEMEVIGDLLVEPDSDGFPAWLLVRDDEDGRRAQVEYTDYWYRNKPYGGPDSPHRAIVGVEQISTSTGSRTRSHARSGNELILHMNYARNFKDNTPKRGERFLLYPRFTDFTTDSIIRFLEQLDQAGAGLFLELLRNPEQTAAPLPLPRKVTPWADRMAGMLSFTPSQETAYETICQQHVTAVWGPPGTGKTHFLASAIIGLAAAHAHAGLSFRVLVTACTHAAIENLLRKLAQMQQAAHQPYFRGLRDFESLPLAKAKYWQGPTPHAEVIGENDLADWLDRNPTGILGATPYSCLKVRDELPGFDLVVIDEASQVRVPEAAVAISLVGKAGRLVLAGDHLQLPPIIAGTYPDAPPGEPVLHRSILEAVCPPATASPLAPVAGERGRGEGARQPQSRILRPLLENFRMNDVLTSIAAKLLYGPGYRCVDAAVADHRLPFRPASQLDELVQACLDPAAPLVLVILDGIRASQANPVEADLVAQLVAALRDGLRDGRGRRYADDASFFRHGVFIVSPHHAQIQAIQHELAEQRHWRVRPFVDTVDKMQGQEADAVIVSYGVADPEFALREAEFIYGLNRLNVAITRARSKCLVCLPRPLLDATPQVLDVESAAVGLAFMRRLVSIAESAGEELLFEGEEVEARVLRVKLPINLGVQARAAPGYRMAGS